MTKRQFKVNIWVSLSLGAGAMIAVALMKFGYISDDLFVQFTLGAFAAHLLFRVIAPYVFTKGDAIGTPEMQENFRKHPLGPFFLIEDEQDLDDHGKHVGVGIMCGHVNTNERPLRYISRGPEDEWDFMCGETDHDTQASVDSAIVICPNCAMNGLNLPQQVKHLKAGHAAEFDPKSNLWTVTKMSDEDIDLYYGD